MGFVAGSGDWSTAVALATAVDVEYRTGKRIPKLSMQRSTTTAQLS
jgi:hypothetical protein